MSKEFRIPFEVSLPGTPEQVFAAISEGSSGWLFPVEYEPRQGGAAAFGGVVTVWDPPRRLVTRVEGPDGWFNQLENEIEPRPGGAYLRYVHSGVFTENWDAQFDGATQHTAFYLHTLGQYLEHFVGQKAIWVDLNAPQASAGADGFERVRAALGVAADLPVETEVQVGLPGVAPIAATLDYSNEHFLGLRTEDTLIRVFGRNAWGAPVGLVLHLFAPGADPAAATEAWQRWLDAVFA